MEGKYRGVEGGDVRAGIGSWLWRFTSISNTHMIVESVARLGRLISRQRGWPFSSNAHKLFEKFKYTPTELPTAQTAP